jgi:hypothetical protein
MMRAKKLPSLPTDDKVNDPAQDKIDAGAKSIMNDKSNPNTTETLTNYMKDIISGKAPEQAHKEATSNAIIKQNPDLLKFPEGRVGIDRTTGIKWRYFPDGRIEREK